MNRRHQQREGDEGQVLVLFALFAFVLIGAIALAVDVGFLLSERREAQAAADAAALAGARALMADESNAEVVAAAQQYAVANGQPAGSDDESNMTFVVEGDKWDGTVTVDLTRSVQRFFLGALYTGNWEVSAHAVAETTSRANAAYVLFALDPPGMYVNGSMKLTARNGSIISNSDIGSSGTENVVVSDGYVDAVGTINSNSGWEAPYGIRSNRPAAPDPFADYEAPLKPASPTFSGNYRCKKSTTEDPEEPLGDDCSFAPGYYKNATIRIWDRAEFEPGLYYFENSSIEMKSTSAFIEGIGVNLYFTGNKTQTYFNPGNGGVYLTAPGWSINDEDLVVHTDYRDIVVWIDTCPSQDFDSQGNQIFFLAGVFYAPCANVYLHGNPSGETLNGMLVASTITMKGTSDIVVTYRPYARVASFEIYLIE